MNEQLQQQNWFARNWLWVVPVGGCFTIILLFIFGIGTIFFGVTNVLKNSTPYEYAVELASNNSKVIEYLGESIETDGIMSGNISIKNNGYLKASPRAVMNALYTGPYRDLKGTDNGGHCSIWGQWPQN